MADLILIKSAMTELPVASLKNYFTSLQARIVDALESLDGGGRFHRDGWQRPAGGGGLSCVLEEGARFERGGVNLSHVQGGALPASATAARPELAGRAFEAMGVSLVLHPRNPYVPTTHMNVRVFMARPKASRRCGGLAAAWT